LVYKNAFGKFGERIIINNNIWRHHLPLKVNLDIVEDSGRDEDGSHHKGIVELTDAS